MNGGVLLVIHLRLGFPWTNHSWIPPFMEIPMWWETSWHQISHSLTSSWWSVHSATQPIFSKVRANSKRNLPSMMSWNSLAIQSEWEPWNCANCSSNVQSSVFLRGYFSEKTIQLYWATPRHPSGHPSPRLLSLGSRNGGRPSSISNISTPHDHLGGKKKSCPRVDVGDENHRKNGGVFGGTQKFSSHFLVAFSIQTYSNHPFLSPTMESPFQTWCCSFLLEVGMPPDTSPVKNP